MVYFESFSLSKLHCGCFAGFFLFSLLFILRTFISHVSLFFLFQWNRIARTGEVILQVNLNNHSTIF